MTGEFPPDEDMSEREREIYEEAKKEGRCFHQKSLWKRFLVIFMGPFMNFMLAFLIFVVVFGAYGLPVESSRSTVIGDITPNQPAAKAGLRPGHKIISVNGTEVDNWEEMASLIHNAGETIDITYQDGDRTQTAEITPVSQEGMEGKIIGIYPQLIKRDVSALESIQLGARQTVRVFSLTIEGFVQMISRRSAEDLGGPIMIASIVGQAARSGFSKLLNWMAIISINLGIINLLPFPALDGGRLVFLGVELVRGKPVDPEKEGFVHFIGFILLMVLMVFIIYRDLVRSIF